MQGLNNQLITPSLESRGPAALSIPRLVKISFQPAGNPKPCQPPPSFVLSLLHELDAPFLQFRYRAINIVTGEAKPRNSWIYIPFVLIRMAPEFARETKNQPFPARVKRRQIQNIAEKLSYLLGHLL